MIARKKEFYGGIGMMAVFVIVLVLIFSPIFNGHNGLEYLDALYNSISKGSAYYIPKVKEDSGQFAGKEIEVTLRMQSEEHARKTALLLMKSGAMVNVAGSDLKVRGDLGKILENALNDADRMYYNDGNALSAKYGYPEREALYNWWKAFKAMEYDLKAQKKFKEAKIIALATKKALETSYNYYGIEPQSIKDRIWVVISSLLFYVIYTLWYGFSIMFMFEGWGMQLEH